jgi:uncharacterized SAM-binding protein YcdF (DUF218 family)
MLLEISKGLAGLLTPPDATVIFSGGSGKLRPSEAELAARLFESFGIARNRILIENHSLTTAENASFTRSLINARSGERWLLVRLQCTCRAMGAFRKVGLQVEATRSIGKPKALGISYGFSDRLLSASLCAMPPCMSGLDFWFIGSRDAHLNCFRLHKFAAIFLLVRAQRIRAALVA